MSPREPPGPSGPPVLGETLAFVRDPQSLVSDLVEAYGPVHRVRVLGVGEFYNVTHPAGIEQVLEGKRDAFRKSDGYRLQLGQSVIAAEGDRWERQRRALEEFFYPERIRSYADRMVELTARRAERWSHGETLSLHEAMNRTTLDNFFATVFDRPLDPDGDEQLRRAAADLNLWFKPTSFALPRWIPTPARRRFHDAVETLEEEARRLLDERRSETAGDPGEDLLSTLVALQADGEASLSDREIVDQVIGLTFAGHDTTAVLLTSALHQLGTHDDVRERFHEELSTVLGDERPTLADVTDLPVTRNVIDETLRAYPPIHTVPRETTRAVDIDGYRLEPDMRVHVSVRRVHNAPDYWADPGTWCPSRWRDTTPRDKGYAFVPFGAGPRACLGRRFARLEATLVLTTIGQRYHLEPERPLEFEPMSTQQPAHDVPVTVHRR